MDEKMESVKTLSEGKAIDLATGELNLHDVV